MAYTVMVPQGRPDFHRSVYVMDGDTATLKEMLTFPSGQAVDLDGDQLRAVAADIGTRLVFVDKKGKVAEDQEIPKEFKDLIAEDKEIRAKLHPTVSVPFALNQVPEDENTPADDSSVAQPTKRKKRGE